MILFLIVFCFFYKNYKKQQTCFEKKTIKTHFFIFLNLFFLKSHIFNIFFQNMFFNHKNNTHFSFFSFFSTEQNTPGVAVIRKPGDKKSSTQKPKKNCRNNRKI